MIKRCFAALLLAAMLLLCAQAGAELGFAEIAKENVNVRESAGGKTKWQLDAPQSVYVFEEKTVGTHLWCHVYTYIGKNPRDGWIRGDMLRFLSEEFTDIVDVEAGTKYVLGIRSDGTVAIMGDDMPHSPCIETVRTWRNIKRLSSYSVGVQGLKTDGMVVAAGRQAKHAGMCVVDICGDYTYPIGDNGEFLFNEWHRSNDYGNTDGLRGLQLREVAGAEWMISAALTTDGNIHIFPEASESGHGSWRPWLEEIEHIFVNGPYTDIEQFRANFIALRADGRVEAASLHFPAAADTQDWENVVKVAAGSDFTLGLRSDGTVCFAGDDPAHARQVESLTDVIDIAAGEDFCIALRKDGSVVMAGEFREGYFR